MDSGTNTRPPRGALVVIAVGLIATVAAAALATDEAGGSSAEIEWDAGADPRLAGGAIPGGGSMRLEDGDLRATETNINGERSSSPLGPADRRRLGGRAGRVLCRMRGGGAELGRTVNSRGAFPRSSGETT